MNEEVKKKWAEALRSGEYKQTSCHLRHDGGFCCLGVLCDISGLGKWDDTDYLVDNYRAAGLLHHEVMKWAGLEDSNPTVDGWTLSQLNDDFSVPFNEIADLIEEHL